MVVDRGFAIASIVAIMQLACSGSHAGAVYNKRARALRKIYGEMPKPRVISMDLGPIVAAIIIIPIQWFAVATVLSP